MNLFKRKPKEETVSRAEYDAKLKLIAALESDLLLLQRRIGRLTAELAAANVDAAKYRRSVANLKQNRPRDKQQAEVGA